MASIDQTTSLPHALRARSKAGVGLWGTTREAFWIALEALRAHKLRSFLTLLGVVIATTTLIVVMSIINGMNLYIADHIANLGANVFIVSQYQWAQGYEAWLKARRRNKPMRTEEFDFLKENLRGYKNIGATAGMWSDSNSTRYQGHTLYNEDLSGVTPSMIDIGSQKVESGRYIIDSDYQHEAMVCFIGHDLVKEFFPSVDPLGKEILVNDLPFQVVGVAETIGSTFGESQDNFAVIPLTTYRKFFAPRLSLAINVQAYDSQQMLELEDEARALLRARRHVPYHEDDNFGINASQTIMALWDRLMGSIFAATIGIVAVFMVVGGIVIMNIMLASVTERTHEIGIRKSLGARRRDILTQFVIESIVMAGTGGAIGVLLAFIVSAIVDHFWTSTVPLKAVFVGLALSSAVGLFFGIYPASQAAKLDPIEALRTEN
ncbi:MAG TPA: ABC transporter permease [Terriglobia bacterium]|nr:ABC transporter permease [Terriglobia bacterium]